MSRKKKKRKKECSLYVCIREKKLLQPSLDLAGGALLLDDGGRGDLLDGGVAELQVLLESGRVLDLDPDDGGGHDERRGADGPLWVLSVFA